MIYFDINKAIKRTTCVGWKLHLIKFPMYLWNALLKWLKKILSHDKVEVTVFEMYAALKHCRQTDGHSSIDLIYIGGICTKYMGEEGFTLKFLRRFSNYCPIYWSFQMLQLNCEVWQMLNLRCYNSTHTPRCITNSTITYEYYYFTRMFNKFSFRKI